MSPSLAESRKPFANGLLSIFSFVIYSTCVHWPIIFIQDGMITQIHQIETNVSRTSPIAEKAARKSADSW